MSSATPVPSASATARITDYYRRVRMMSYIEQFNKDPLRLSNPRLLWDECEWVSVGINHILALKKRSPSGRAVPAEVRLIGEISEDRFNLFIDGGWEGKYDDGIEKARATGRLVRGRIPEVSGLWPLFLEALREISMARGPSKPGRQFPIVENGTVKLRHKIFLHVSKIQDSPQFPPRRELESTPSFNLKREDMSTPVSSQKKDGPCLPSPEIGASALTQPGTEDQGVLDAAHVKDEEFDFIDVTYIMPDPTSAPDAYVNQVRSLDTTGNRDDASSDTIEQFSDVVGGGEDTNGAVEDGVTSEDSCSSSDDLGPEFEMINWICGTKTAQSALEKLIEGGEYIGRPIPVFSLHGERVSPAEYESRLKGALVDVTMTITNVSYKQWGFFGDITSIVILAPPGYGPVPEATAKRVKKQMAKPAHLKKFLSDERGE